MLKQPVLEGSRFICAQLQVKNLKFELEREEKVVSCFQFVCNKTPHGMTLSVQLRGQEEEMILWWTELCHSTRLHSLDTVLSQMMRSQIMDNGICHTDVQQAIPCTCQKRT